MTKVKRSWDILDDEKRRATVTAIIDFFECERNEKIGVVAAGEILDFMLQTFGSDLYNKGVEDSVDFIKKNFESLEVDMNAVLKK